MKSEHTIQNLVIGLVIFLGAWICNAEANNQEPSSPPNLTMQTFEPIYSNTSTVITEPEALAWPRGRAFLKIDGVDGESTSDRYKNWIDIFGFSNGLSNSSSLGIGSSGGRNRGEFEDIVIIKELDKSSPILAFMSASERRIRRVEMDFVTVDPNHLDKYFEIDLENVLITSVSHQMVLRGKESVMMEIITLDYIKTRWTYWEYDRITGTPTGQIDFIWDRERGSGSGG